VARRTCDLSSHAQAVDSSCLPPFLLNDWQSDLNQRCRALSRTGSLSRIQIINRLYRVLRSVVAPTSQIGWQQVKPGIIWKLTQFRNPPSERPYQNETVYSLSSKSFQRSEDLAQLLFERSASLPLFLVWPDRSDEDSSQNSRSVRRRTSSKPNARRKAQQGTLSGTLGGSAITHHKNSPSNQETRSGQGKGSPNCLCYIQQIQTLQAENASPQRQLRGVKRIFKCPLCPHEYTRIDLLNRHIRHSLDYRHQYIAAKIKQTWCFICSEKFTRPEEVVKHERKYHKISQSRAELAFALSPSLIASGENYQPDTSIHLTSEAQVLNALELENAASSANLEPASSISGLNIRTTEQRGFNNFLNGLERPNSSSNGLSNELDDLLSCVAGQDSPSNGLSNRFCSWPVEHGSLPGGIAGQGNSSNGLSNELDNFLSPVAGQDSFSNGLSNRLCSWQVEPSGFPDGISGQGNSSNGLSNELDDLLSCVAGQDSSSNGLSNRFCSWPVEHGGFPDGIAGQGNSSNGLSNELDDFLNHVAGQDSSSNGLSNRFCSWPVEPSGFPDGISGQGNFSNGLPNELDDFLNHVAGQDSSSNGLSNRLCSWPVEHGGLPDGISGQSSCSDGFSGWPGEHGGLPDGVAGPNSPGNGLSNGLGGLVFNGLEGPNALPDGVGGGRSCVNGFPARPGPH